MDAHHDETNIGIWKIEMPESSLEDKFSAPVHKWDLPNLPKDTEIWLEITLFPGEASSQQVHNSEASEILNKIEAYNGLSGSQSPGHNQDTMGVKIVKSVCHSETLKVV
ncbi:hypothetical protein Tco_1083932 [Tanacetum coccineum]